MTKSANGPAGMNTNEAAKHLGINPNSLRTALCRNGGNYYGIIPARLPNHRLSWPAPAVLALARGEPQA